MKSRQFGVSAQVRDHVSSPELPPTPLLTFESGLSARFRSCDLLSYPTLVWTGDEQLIEAGLIGFSLQGFGI